MKQFPCAVEIEPVMIPAGSRLRGHGHEQPHLFLLSRGAYRERYGRRFLDFAGGQVRFSPAGDEHDMVFPCPSRGLVILLPAQGEARELFTERVTPHPEATGAALRQLAALAPRTDPGAIIQRQLALLEILGTGLRWSRGDRRRAPAWLRAVRSAIRSQAGQPYDARRLGRDFGVHPTHLAREFSRHFGCAPSEYARRLRARRATLLLSRSQLSLPQVALDAGYADQSHLCRSLKRYLGCTPTALRQRYRLAGAGPATAGDG